MQFLVKGIVGFAKCRREILLSIESVFEQTKIFEDGRNTVLDGQIMHSASRLPIASLAAKAAPAFKGFELS